MVECVKNGDCTTGFCDDGLCRNPKLLEPCSYINDKCPNNQECDMKIDRCVFKSLEKPDGLSCTSNAKCHPDKYCYNSVCIDRGRLGDSCIIGRDCADGTICKDEKCVQKCDPSGTSQFGCNSGEECKTSSGLLGYCAVKESKSYSSGDSSSSSSGLLGVFFVVFVLGAALIFIFAFLKRKRSKRPHMVMQTPLPHHPSPTYATPIVVSPQPYATPIVPSSPTYPTAPPSQPPSYYGPPPGSSPHHYPSEKR